MLGTTNHNSVCFVAVSIVIVRYKRGFGQQKYSLPLVCLIIDIDSDTGSFTFLPKMFHLDTGLALASFLALARMSLRWVDHHLELDVQCLGVNPH